MLSISSRVLYVPKAMMTNKTTKLLNQLNLDFYAKVGPHFDSSRQHFWPGWWRVSELIRQNLNTNQTHLKVLDVGCGNGRFASFLETQFPELSIEYTGIDSDQFFLDKTRERGQGLTSVRTVKIDLIEHILDNKPFLGNEESFNVIVYFGVQHHIPGLKNRETALKLLKPHLQKRGLLCMTCWQFDNLPQFKNRQLAPNSVGVASSDLEAGDFLLDWHRGTTAIRYCHLTQLPEATNALQEAGLTLLESYSADTELNTGNLYLVAKLVD